MATTITNLSTRIKVTLASGKSLYFAKGSIGLETDGNSVWISDPLHKPQRIVYTDVVGMGSVAALVNLILGYEANYSPVVGATTSSMVISDAAIITAITNEANWSTGDFVDPSTIITQIGAIRFYIDSTNGILYFCDGTTLVRSRINNIG